MKCHASVESVCYIIDFIIDLMLAGQQWAVSAEEPRKW